MNEGFGEDLYRKGNSVKRSGPFSETESETEKLLFSSPSPKSVLTLGSQPSSSPSSTSPSCPGGGAGSGGDGLSTPGRVLHHLQHPCRHSKRVVLECLETTLNTWPYCWTPTCPIDLWAPLQIVLASLNRLSKSCSILDMRQLLEALLQKSTLAIATWRGDAQRYWLDQTVGTARVRHEQWLQRSRDQRANLEPTYILGDRKLIPELVNAVESVLRNELLDAMPKFIMTDTCVRHGWCTAELIIWYIMKQVILPPDVSEVDMQKETLTLPKIPPSTLDQASKWLEEAQRQLNVCIKTKLNVHPRTLVALERCHPLPPRHSQYVGSCVQVNLPKWVHKQVRSGI